MLLPTVVGFLLRVAARGLILFFCGAHERKTFPAKSYAPARKFKKSKFKT